MTMRKVYNIFFYNDSHLLLNKTDYCSIYNFPLATVTPTVCMTSDYGASSGSWIVCQVNTATAWISAATSTGGTYQAD